MELRHFGIFELDLESGELRRRGRRVPLAEKPFRVLVALLERPGQVISRQDLRSRLWPDGTHVDFDANLNAAVRSLREALGDSASNPRFVETLPRRGYRFIAPTSPPPTPEPAPSPDAGSGPEKGSRSEPTRAASPVPAAARPRPRRWLWVSLACLAVAFALVSQRTGVPEADEGRSGVGSRDGVGSRNGVGPAPGGPPARLRQMLLVLPFDNLDPTPERDFVAAGLTDELISQIGRVRPEKLGVIARTSSRAYADSPHTVAEIALELGVDWVLEGSVRSDDPSDPTRLRVSSRLVAALDQTPLWTRTWETGASDVLEIQSEIALAVARALALELLPGDRSAVSSSATPSAEAFELYLRGRGAWQRFAVADLERAADYFGQALAIDPRFAPALAGLADAHNLLAIYTDRQEEHFERALEAAERAIELDPAVAEAHNALGYVQLYHRWDFAAAEASFDRALELAPHFAMAHHYRTGLLSALGRHDEALAAGHRAEELDPRSLSVRSDLGWYYLFADRPAGAVRECRRTLEQDPHYGWAISCLVLAHAELGQWPDAWRAAERRLRLDGVDEATIRSLEADDPSESIRRYRERRLELQRAEMDFTVGPVGSGGWPFGTAGSHALLGQADPALALLERAHRERDIWMVFLAVHPAFRALRDDPRFAELGKQVGVLGAAEAR